MNIRWYTIIVALVLGACSSGLASPREIKLDSDAWRAEKAARDKMIARAPNRGYLMRLAASKHAATGNADRAVELLDQVISEPETTFDKVSALRLKGLYLSWRSPSMAIDPLKEAMGLWDENPDLRSSFKASFASTMIQLETSLLGSGSADEALAINLRLSEPEAQMPPMVAADALWRRVGMLEGLGHGGRARDAVDELLRRFPDYGRGSELYLSVRFKAAKLRFPDPSSPELRGALVELWTDESLRTSPLILAVGTQLYLLEFKQGLNASAIATAVEMVLVTDEHRTRWESFAQSKEATERFIDSFCVRALWTVAYSDALGFRAEALWATQRLIPMLGDDGARDLLSRREAALMRALNP